MKALFLDYLNVGAACGVFILLFWGCSALIDRRCAAKWKRLVWVLLSLRLALPFALRLTQPKVVIPMPAGPLTGEEGVPLLLGQTAGITAPRGVTVLDALAAIWLVGVVISAGGYLVSFTHYRRRIGKEARLEEDMVIHSLLKDEAAAVGLRCRPRLVRWADCASPMVMGAFRPVLVLPEEDYSTEELRLIFRHELNHIKRGDLLLKLLMAAAKAIHWYNPAVRLLPVLADVDMELSCDDEVTRNSPDAVRKAYSEILFSFVRRQYSRGAGTPARAFTTQFYGGKQIMKKRFGNILSGREKRRGAVLLVLAVAVLLTVGSLAACGEAPVGNTPGGEEPAETPAPTPEETSTPEPTPLPMEPTSAPLEAEYVETEPVVGELNDRENLNLMVNDFTVAYFSGDMEKVKEVLFAGPERDLEVYHGGEATNVLIKGLDKVPDEVAEGVVYTISIQFLADGEDSLTYLTTEVVKEGGYWQVQWYGLEK